MCGKEASEEFRSYDLLLVDDSHLLLGSIFTQQVSLARLSGSDTAPELGHLTHQLFLSIFSGGE